MVVECYHVPIERIRWTIYRKVTECKNSGGNCNNKHSHVLRNESRCALENQLQLVFKFQRQINPRSGLICLYQKKDNLYGGYIASGALGILVVVKSHVRVIR